MTHTAHSAAFWNRTQCSPTDNARSHLRISTCDVMRVTRRCSITHRNGALTKGKLCSPLPSFIFIWGGDATSNSHSIMLEAAAKTANIQQIVTLYLQPMASGLRFDSVSK